MTGTNTKRISEGITESTTKRITAAVAESVTKRVTAAIAEGSTQRVYTQSVLGGQESSLWKSSWGDTRQDKGSGACTRGDSWGGSWSWIAFAHPSLVVTKRGADGATENSTKRITETPQA